MKPSDILFDEPRTTTLAELCEALADGALRARVEDGDYLMTRQEVARFAQYAPESSQVSLTPVLLFEHFVAHSRV